MERTGILSRSILAVAILVAAAPAGWAAITVTSNGPMQQINTAGIPGSYMREFSTIWESGNPNAGAIFYVDSASSPYTLYRASTTDGGLTWTAGQPAGLARPAGVASQNQQNPVIRDFNRDGNLTGFFGSVQGVSSGLPGYPNTLHYRAVSTATPGNIGPTWSGETLISYNSGAFPGQTGLNGFIEVFETSSGTLRGYLAGNRTVNLTSTTHLVESTDGGLTWQDMGLIQIPGPGTAFNTVGANGPVFWFTDDADGQRKMGWFCYGEGSNNRGVAFLISTDEGLSWTKQASIFNLVDATIRSGDANFISDDTVRLFYYRNTGSVPSDRQLWYQDFTLTGMSGIVANNLTLGAAPI
ncbi:MAG TPA: sialidase family protein, partial [Phycisphaerae bacterium]|nr:sialidase family protein [Phycisphaerae bacterium]